MIGGLEHNFMVLNNLRTIMFVCFKVRAHEYLLSTLFYVRFRSIG